MGNPELAPELRDRILHSRGGTFLVTGFRGVGKSTIVLRALDVLAQECGDSEVLVPVVLSVARATDTDRLLFAVVRRVFESLNDQGLMERLPASIQRSLLLAYMRTSLAFKQTNSDSLQASGSIGSSGAPKKILVPSVSLSAQRTRSLATEAQFLAYSETDVEHDIMRIVSLLDHDGQIRLTSGGRLRRLWLWPRPLRARIRLVVVLDEADKLTDGEPGLLAAEALLGGIKNVLTMTGAHFILVAGPDLHDRVIKDAARGNSVYESVFGWRMYVPCSWNAVDILMDKVLSEEAVRHPDVIAAFSDYLRFKARGVPRRLLQEFNTYVFWRDGKPVLCVRPSDADRVLFYARLQVILQKHLDSGGVAGLFSVPIDEDRRRLSAYYVIDWVLRTDGELFRAEDLVKQGEDAELDPMLHVALRPTERLLDHLADQEILEIVHEASPSSTLYGDTPEARQKVYRLAGDVIQDLLRFAARNEAERAALSLPRPQASETSPGIETKVIGGRYQVLRTIAQGGMGSVSLGRDLVLGRAVAIKMPAKFLKEDENLRARFHREAELTARMQHAHIIRCYDVVQTDDYLAMILELLQGINLDAEIARTGPMNGDQAAAFALVLADVLDYLDQKQVVRIDLKPANIIMHPSRGPILIDLGIAKTVNLASLTDAGAMVGTPMFMAPEQAEGKADHRSDIHALGLLIFFCLTGWSPLTGDDMAMSHIFARLLNNEIDVSHLAVSQKFREVIARSVRRDPAERYQHAAELLRDLKETPEAGQSTEGSGPDPNPGQSPPRLGRNERQESTEPPTRFR